MNYTAEYRRRVNGTSICMANTIEELMETLFNRGYNFNIGERERILDWDNTNQKKYYGARLTIRRGELEMTEYTSC